MKVNHLFFLGVNPFFDAYVNSDFLGKIIFICLIILSVASWVIIIQKIIISYNARKNSNHFYNLFQHQKSNPLGIEYEKVNSKRMLNPFFDLYSVLRKSTVEILNKNRKFGKVNQEIGLGESTSYLSPSDIDFVESHLLSTVASQTKGLEKNLFILSTIVSLAPFLGLLGTVWGILTTFSELQSQSGGGAHQMVLSGLSLALATTVLGLLDAIPALIGYNYLKNNIHNFQTEMEGFSTEILTSVEMQYRKVE